METRKLAVFVDLAATLSYSRSAERLFLSQSTISKDILALEQAWQVQLFVQVHRRVQLTRAGQQILPKVQALLQHDHELEQAITGRFWQEDRPLVIQGLASLSQYRSFRILTAFAQQHPEIPLQFSEASVDQLTHALDQKNVDVVITRLFGPAPAAYQTLMDEQDQYVALVPKQHALVQQKSVTLAAVLREKVLLQPAMFSQTSSLFTAIQAAQVRPQLTYVGQRTELLLALVNQGAGVSIVHRRAVDLTPWPNIQVVPLHPTMSNHVVMMKQRDNPAAVVDLFWQFATAEMGREG